MKQKTQITVAIVVSLLVHATIVSALIVSALMMPDMAAGEKEYIVSVEMIADDGGQRTENLEEKSKIQISKSKTNPKSKYQMKQSTSDELRATTTGDGGTSTILAKIKAKIEQGKIYPRLAKKMGIEGRPTVTFQINPDGSIKYVNVTSSSGEKMIDDAAVETVKRAAPLPFYSSPIRLAIRYELK